jgi:hypothetical protein
MSRPRISPSAVLAAAALAAGAGMTLWTAARWADGHRRIIRRVEALDALRPIQAELLGIDADLARLNRRPPPDAETPADLLAGVAPEAGWEPGDAGDAPAYGGWALRRHAMVLPAIAPAALGRWIEACERAPAPWRLVSARLVALDAEARQVRADVVWERPVPAGNGPDADAP